MAEQQCSALMAFASQQTHGFLWHKHRFHLDVVLTTSGRYILSGRTKVGDAIQDEWVVAKLVFDITRTFPTIVGRVFDSDGEFLLIESAEALPDWVTPENSDRRIFVVDGKVHIAPPTDKTQKKESHCYDEDALLQVLDSHIATEASSAVQRLIQHKLNQVPTYMRDNMHRVWCLLPEKVAHVFSANHELVGPAVEAFYYREPKHAGLVINKMATFLPPNDPIIEFQVTFSRAHFAQLKQQHFYPPTAFLRHNTRYNILTEKDQGTTHSDAQAADLGVKLACGLELLHAGDDEDQFQRPWKERILETLQQARNSKELSALPIAPDDDDSWLYIHPDTLDRKLERVAATRTGAASGVAELDNMAKRVGDFVDGVSGVEGVEGMEPVHFDLDAFMKLLSRDESCSDADSSAPRGEHCMDEDESSQSDSDDENALDEAMAEMEAELASTKVAQSFTHAEALKDTHQRMSSSKEESSGLGSTTSSSAKPLDLNFNLLSNLLESLASQEGHAGPVSNILSQMNFPHSSN